MKKFKVTVHRLPTEDKSQIGLCKHSERQGIFYGETPTIEDSLINQHLYITTEPENDDFDIDQWVLFNDGEVFQVHSISQDYLFNKNGKQYDPDYCETIIATTDPKLLGYTVKVFSKFPPPDSNGDFYEGTFDVTHNKIVFYPSGEIERVITNGHRYKDDMYRFELVSKGFPQIPQSFIEEYCKSGGIDEMLVEMERMSNKGEWKDVLLPSEWGDHNPTRPKLNPDNTIIIHPVEEKMYSREEVLTAFVAGFKSCEDGNSDTAFFIQDLGNKWIEENL